MKLRLLTGAAVAAALLLSAPAEAQRAPSRHVRCDGMPDNVTGGETAARLLGAVTLLGLFAPPPEAADSGARLSAAAGVAICGEALAVESNEVRRAELILAAAIHHIEAEQYQQAIDMARTVATDRPALADSPAFRRSLYLSALDIEAWALLEMGRTQEAVAKALEMARAAPYDLINLHRAAYYVGYAPRWGEAETAFYENMVRLHPQALLQRAFVREFHGDFSGALADYDLYIRIMEEQLGGVAASLRTRIAIAHALAGNVARAEELIRRAETPPRVDGKDSTPAQPTSAAVEMTDLYRVWRALHEGDAERARTLFLARSQWIHPDVVLRARLVARLRDGARPEQLTGALAQTPEQIRAAFDTERREAARGNKGPGTVLFSRRRPYVRVDDFGRFSRDVWRMQRSRIIDFPQNEEPAYRVFSASRVGGGTPAGYAILLHAALRARSEGKTAFTIFPSRGDLAQLSVRFGNRGETGMIDELTWDAGRVIADLSPIIPQPTSR